MPDANREKPVDPRGLAVKQHRWKPGESGNPTGRPKDLKIIKDLAKSHSKEAIMTLIAIMNDTSQKAVSRIAAANSVLDRGYGKVSQEVVIKGTGNNGQIQMEHMARVLETDELQEYRKMLLKANTAIIEGTVSAVLGDDDETVIEAEAEPEQDDLGEYE